MNQMILYLELISTKSHIRWYYKYNCNGAAAPRHKLIGIMFDSFAEGELYYELVAYDKYKLLYFIIAIECSIHDDMNGVLFGVGASLKHKVNGSVVIYTMKDNGNVLCNLLSRTLLRFGKVHCIKFMKYNPCKYQLL